MAMLPGCDDGSKSSHREGPLILGLYQHWFSSRYYLCNHHEIHHVLVAFALVIGLAVTGPVVQHTDNELTPISGKNPEHTKGEVLPHQPAPGASPAPKYSSSARLAKRALS